MSYGEIAFGMMIFILPFWGLAIWKLSSKTEKLERRIDELSDFLAKRFNIEI